MDWENLRHFATLARSGSLSAAARLIGVEHATIARRVAALEAETGLKLVDRRGRRLLLTEEGKRIAAIAERMEGEVLAIERAAQGNRPGLEGEVTISAPPALAAKMLGAPIVALRRQHPGIRLKILGETRFASLNRREADIAVRLSRPEQGDLTIVRTGQIAFQVYGSRDYLAATPEADWSFIAYDEAMADAPQQKRLLQFAKGRPVGLRVSTVELQVAATRAGGGIAILPDFMVAGEEGLVRIPENEPLLTRDIWLAVHSDLRDVPIIRAVMQALRFLPSRPDDGEKN